MRGRLIQPPLPLLSPLLIFEILALLSGLVGLVLVEVELEGGAEVGVVEEEEAIVELNVFGALRLLVSPFFTGLPPLFSATEPPLALALALTLLPRFTDTNASSFFPPFEFEEEDDEEANKLNRLGLIDKESDLVRLEMRDDVEGAEPPGTDTEDDTACPFVDDDAALFFDRDLLFFKGLEVVVGVLLPDEEDFGFGDGGETAPDMLLLLKDGEGEDGTDNPFDGDGEDAEGREGKRSKDGVEAEAAVAVVETKPGDKDAMGLEGEDVRAWPPLPPAAMPKPPKPLGTRPGGTLPAAVTLDVILPDSPSPSAPSASASPLSVA